MIILDCNPILNARSYTYKDVKEHLIELSNAFKKYNRMSEEDFSILKEENISLIFSWEHLVLNRKSFDFYNTMYEELTNILFSAKIKIEEKYISKEERKPRFNFINNKLDMVFPIAQILIKKDLPPRMKKALLLPPILQNRAFYNFKGYLYTDFPCGTPEWYCPLDFSAKDKIIIEKYSKLLNRSFRIIYEDKKYIGYISEDGKSWKEIFYDNNTLMQLIFTLLER
jgi:hypothetical protein